VTASARPGQCLNPTRHDLRNQPKKRILESVRIRVLLHFQTGAITAIIPGVITPIRDIGRRSHEIVGPDRPAIPL
jgi:hypothetical protein